MGQALLAIIVMLALGGPALAAPTGTLTQEELRDMPPRERQKQVSKDLLGMFEAWDDADSGFRRSPDATLMTRPVGTGYKGLCRRDWVTVFYEYEGPEDADARDQPIHPERVVSEAYYKFTSVPDAEMEKSIHRGRDFTRSMDCARAGEERYLGWFSAPSEHAAMNAGLALEVLRAWVRDDRYTLRKCNGETPVEAAASNRAIFASRCSEAFREEMPDAQLHEVRLCEAEKGQGCFDFTAGMWMVQVRTARTSWLSPLTATDVISVDADMMIIVD